MNIKSTLAALALTLSPSLLAGAAQAEGYLALKAEKLEELELGLGEAGFGISQTRYEMETGKAYKLEITSTGAQECAFHAPDFFNFIWLRKVEVEGVEIKASGLYEIEFESDGEAELIFVPIRPGEFAFSCAGLEHKGMTGVFSVK
ncbi:MAG: hypothetical protein MRY63_10940 [Neomegalonema sp.]|nr:hypothetical protein [Neomegalonema sp.]